MAEKEYRDCRFNYNPISLDVVDITDIKGESVQVSYVSLQRFVGEMFKERLINEINEADLTDDMQFIRMMNLFTKNN